MNDIEEVRYDFTLKLKHLIADIPKDLSTSEWFSIRKPLKLAMILLDGDYTSYCEKIISDMWDEDEDGNLIMLIEETKWEEGCAYYRYDEEIPNQQ